VAANPIAEIVKIRIANWTANNFFIVFLSVEMSLDIMVLDWSIRFSVDDSGKVFESTG
jgi:hypothetical protein